MAPKIVNFRFQLSANGAINPPRSLDISSVPGLTSLSSARRLSLLIAPSPDRRRLQWLVAALGGSTGMPSPMRRRRMQAS
jgi:hypothetical protein